MSFIIIAIFACQQANLVVAQNGALERKILLLFSNEAELPANRRYGDSLISTFREKSTNAVVFYTEFLDAVRFPGSAQDERTASFIVEKYAGVDFDLVITAGPQALDFLIRHRNVIAPNVSVVFSAVSRGKAKSLEPLSDATGIVSRYDPAPTLEMAMRLQPRARDVVVITGVSAFEKDWEAYTRDQFKPYDERLTISYLSGLPVEEILDRVRKLPRDTIILYIGIFQDGTGRYFIAPEIAGKISRAAGAPTYAVYSTMIDKGVVGGYMDTFEAVGRETAVLGLRILRGEKPASIPPYEAETHKFIVDWRELQRWGLREADLPAGTEIRFKPPSAWEQYKLEISLILALTILQSILLTRFFLEVRKRRSAERMLIASSEQMNLTVEALNMGLWDWNAKTDSISGSERFRKLFGFDQSENLTEQAVLDRIHPDDRERCERIPNESIACKLPFEMEYRVPRADGSVRWFLAKGSPRSDNTGYVDRVLGVVTDITERKCSELEAAEQRKELTHLTRVSILGALSGALAHELNQPLAAILSNAQAGIRLASRRIIDIKEIRQILGDIAKDDKRAGEVIQHLRALLKKGDPQTQAVDINSVVSDALQISHSTLTLKNTAVRTRMTKHLPTVKGDPVQLQQVALNLIMNANEAMNGNEGDDRVITVTSGRGNEGHIRISVADNGHGIAGIGIDQAFKPFVTTKALGLGLGLPICHWIVVAHRGQIWAEANPDRGATFHVELPIHEDNPCD